VIPIPDHPDGLIARSTSLRKTMNRGALIGLPFGARRIRNHCGGGYQDHQR
jgi:hypothetical protein